MQMLSPKAERYGAAVARRLENRALRAFDQYKVQQERKETARLRTFAQMQKEDVSVRSEDERMLGLFHGVDLSGDEDEDEESAISAGSKERFAGKCGRICDKLFATKSRTYLLKWWEFLTILIFLNTSITFNANCVELSLKWGAIMVLVTFLVTETFIASPLFMAYMFLGWYSRRSYIRFWDCVPLMKGLGYSVMLTAMIAEIFNVAFTGLTLLYLAAIMVKGDTPWVDCNFTNAHNDCLPMYDYVEGFRHNLTCCSPKTCNQTALGANAAKFASLDYYVSYMLQRGYGENPLHDGLIPSWVGVVVFIWALLCFFMTVGLRKFRKIFCAIDVIIFILMLPPVVYTIVVSPGYGLMQQMESDLKNIFNGKMWWEFMVHYLYREVPGDVVALSAISVPAVTTTSDTVIIYTLKIFWGAMGIVWTSITAKYVQKSYQIKNDQCVMIRGDFLIFVMMPEVIARSPLGYSGLVTFFIMMFFWNLSISVFILNNAVEALLNEFPILYKFRFLIALVTATIVCGVNVQILCPEFIDYFHLYVRETFPTIISFQLIAAWIGLFIYSIRKIVHDYHFSFAQNVGIYWILGLKLGMVVLCLLIMLLYFQNVVGDGRPIVCIALLWPIPTGIIVMTLRYYMRVNKSLLDPHPNWGPSSKRKRDARALYDPMHDLKYRSNVQRCKHHCLVQSAALKREIKHWQAKLEMVMTILEDEELIQSLETRSTHSALLRE